MLLAALLAAAVVTTGPAENVTTSSAKVTGTVNPGGAATTYHFEYGTTTSYGISTDPNDAGAGNADLGVSANLTGLTAQTTYHYRLVAGGVNGQDRTFKTGPNPRPPSVTSNTQAGTGPTSTTLRAYVTPNEAATTVHFEYGTSTSYGTSTPEQGIGAGTSRIAVSAAVGGLKPNTRYHFRAVATNAAGITRGGDRAFTTSRTPTSVGLTPSTTRPIWGSGMTITGKVGGQGSITVALERQDFPFANGFYQAATTTANGSGNFSFTVPPLFSTTRLRVTTRTALPVSSAVTTASVAVKVGLFTKRLSGKRVRITGATWPAVPAGRVSLQRQTRSGRWIPIKRVHPTALPNNRSRYRFTVARRSRALSYRVVVVPNNGGANVNGRSRTVLVPKR
jgi:hypothetical protein